MKQGLNNDTIAAIGTGPIESAISIIRISGPKTKSIAELIYGVKSANIEPNRQYVKWLIDPADDKKVDHTTFIFKKSPQSYTGEDTLEINCHGGVIITRRILELIINQGARIAERGEFTKRAFLNGKIDLIQVESIIDLIKAKSTLAAKAAVDNLEGKLSKIIERIGNEIFSLLVEIEGSIDFPEDIMLVDKSIIFDIINRNIGELSGLLRNAEFGMRLAQGIRVAIIGKPNVGKSSIFNVLLKRDRSIITAMPGTTTDTIEDIASIGGIPFILSDTAGIRDSKNEIEKEGIKRTSIAADNSDAIIVVIDGSSQIDEDDRKIIGNGLSVDKPCILVINKCDLPNVSGNIEGKFYSQIKISALKNNGFEILEESLIKASGYMNYNDEHEIISNLRQKKIIIDAIEYLKASIESLKKNMPTDLLASDLGGCVELLKSMQRGRIKDEIGDEIFNKFCVGK